MFFLKIRPRISRQLIPWIALIALLAFDLFNRTYVTLSNDIEGDPAAYATIGREIARTLRLQPYFPNFVADPGILYPVAYPQLFFVFLAILYRVGGELGMRLLAPTLGTLSIIVVFISMRKLFDFGTALLSSFLLLGEFHLFVVTTEIQIESAVILFSLIVMFQYLFYLQTGRKSNLALSALFLGLLISTKHQGIVTFFVLILFTFIFVIKEIYHGKAGLTTVLVKNGKRLLLVLAISAVIASPFLLFQISTTGTVDYIPATDISKLFFKPNWKIDVESMKWLEANYFYVYQTSILDLPAFLLLIKNHPTIFTPLLSITIILGFWILISRRKYHNFLLIISSFIGLYLFLMYLMNLPWKYIVLVPVLSMIVASIGARHIFAFLWGLRKADSRSALGRMKKRSRLTVIVCFMALLIVVPTLANLQESYVTTYRGSDKTGGGAYWQNRMQMIREAADWLKSQISDDEIVLVGRTHEVGYYLERKFTSISELGGHNVPKIFAAYNAFEAIKYLKEYNISYIWNSQLYIERFGMEWVPMHGLLDYIDLSSFFRKVYQNDIIRIYQVLYDVEEPVSADKHYYCNVLGDSDDTSRFSPALVDSEERWFLNPGHSRILQPNQTGSIRVNVNQTELNASNGSVTSPFSLVLFYVDSFTGDLVVDLKKGSDTNGGIYQEISRIHGTNSNRLKYHIIRVSGLAYAVDLFYVGVPSLEFQISNGPFHFPLRAILFIPNELVDQQQIEAWALELES